MKSTGIALAVAAIIIFIIDTILKRKQKEDFKTNIKTLVFLIAIVIIVFLSWKCKIMLGGANEKWEINNITISKVLDVLSGRGEYYQKVTIKRFLENTFLEEGTLTSRTMNTLNLLMVIIGLDIFVCTQIKDKELRKRFISLSIILLVSWIIYAFALLITYLFILKSSEAMILTCYNRYMLTIPLGITFIDILFVIKMYKNDRMKLSNIAIIITILLAFMPIKSIQNTYIEKGKNIEATKTSREEFSAILRYSDKMDLDDKVYYISNFENEREIAIVTYEFLPLKIANKSQKLIMRKDEFINILVNEGYTHIYINIADRDLKRQYTDLFEEEMQDETMYEIVKLDEGIRFKKI